MWFVLYKFLYYKDIKEMSICKFNYEKDKELILSILDFKLIPKARPRVYTTKKGKSSVFTPSAANERALSCLMKKQVSGANVDFTTFEGNLGLMASVRGQKKLRGDADNYLKQIKDALQHKIFPIVHDDRQIVSAYVEKVSDFPIDCVIVKLFSIEHNIDDFESPFLYFGSFSQE